MLLSNRSALFAGAGVEAGGSVVLDAYGAIGVQGPMRGHLQLNSYGYAYLDGPLEGTLELNSYSTVVLEQGLTGTIKLRSYANALIRGPFRGKLDAKGSCWSTLYLDGMHLEHELLDLCSENASGDFDQITVHVRMSNLADGEHENIGTWRKVIVNDPIWNKLAR